jgi:RNA polymerase sigma factor (sigma-70 family)
VTHQNDLLIVEKVRAGQVQAFAALVTTYKDMAVILAYNILLNQEDAEEVAQDAFVKAFAALHSFKADSKFSTWLYRIVVNVALNKKKLKKQHPVEITEELSNGLPMDTADAMAKGITTEHRKHIQFALKTLTDKERLCITLHYLNELSVAEICTLTGLTASHVKVLLYRGRKNLYAALHKHLKNEITTVI